MSFKEEKKNWTLEELRNTHADESLAPCPDCHFGNLKSEKIGFGGERILRCSYCECGQVVKSTHEDWPDSIPKSYATVDRN